MTYILALTCGGITSFLLALTGSGGSILGIPLLLYIVGLENLHIVIGTSAIAVSINAFFNLIPYARSGHVHWRKAFLFSGTGVAGAFAGSQIGKSIDATYLTRAFAVLMIMIAVFMISRRRLLDQESTPVAQPCLRYRLAGTGLCAGALAGFFGVGGGFLIVPSLMLSARLKTIDAIATSLFGVGIFGLSTALNYARSDLVNWKVALLFVLGGIVGGWIGSYFARQLADRQGALVVLFAAVVFIVAIYMLWA